MSSPSKPLAERPTYRREPLDVSGPVRSIGGAYVSDQRSAIDGRTVGGVPLQSAKDLAVSFLETAYRVAADQQERSARLAERLHDAGKRAVGDQPERQALDATEQLVFRAFMVALGWMEAVTAPGSGSPIKRMAASQYRGLGALLGLNEAGKQEQARRAHDPAKEQAARESNRQRQEAAGEQISRNSSSVRKLETLIHEGEGRHAIRVLAVEYQPGMEGELEPLHFHHASSRIDWVLEGALRVGERLGLTLMDPKVLPAGQWTAAICLKGGVDLGFIRIEVL